MKTVEGNRFIITVDKNKPFSIFRINDTLYFNATLREQEIEFFENTFTEAYINQQFAKMVDIEKNVFIITSCDDLWFCWYW